MIKKTIADVLPFWHFEGDTLVYSDGSLGVGFLLEGADITSATVEEKNEITTRLENLLTSAPENTKLQIFYRLSPDVDDLLNRHEKISANAPPNYAEIRNYRLKFLRAQAGLGRYFKPEIYVFFRGEPHRFKRQNLLQASKEFTELTEEEFKQHQSKFERQVRLIEGLLKQATLKPRPMTRDEMFQISFEYLNLDRSKTLGVPSLQEEAGPFATPLSDQLVLSDIEVFKDSLQIGDLIFKAVTLKTLPEGQSVATMIDGFTKLPFHFWISQNISVHDQKKEMDKLKLQRRLANSMAAGAKNVSDLESESKLSQLEVILTELLEGSEKIVSSDLNVIVWGKSKEEVDEKTDLILAAFKGMNQAEGVVESLPLLDVFMNAAPAVCKGLRMKRMKSSNAAHLMPVYSFWTGNKDPVCLIPNRDGGLVSINQFANELMSFNGIVLGSSGAGKSFVISALILMFYGYWK